jgi:hypothetical protein
MKYLLMILLLAFNVRAEDAHSPHHGQGDEHSEETAHPEEGHEEGEEEVSSSVGPGNAVPEADAENGFKLSEKAVRTLELGLQAVRPQPTYTLPRSAVAYFKDEAGVYRLREGWFKLIEGDAKTSGNQVVFTPKVAFRDGDQIVVKGVGLLRVADLDAFGGSGDAHAH